MHIFLSVSCIDRTTLFNIALILWKKVLTTEKECESEREKGGMAKAFAFFRKNKNKPPFVFNALLWLNIVTFWIKRFLHFVEQLKLKENICQSRIKRCFLLHISENQYTSLHKTFIAGNAIKIESKKTKRKEKERKHTKKRERKSQCIQH